MAQDRVFVIAEAGSSWRFGNDHLSNAYRMIEEAKECGADAVKFQWTSDYKLMMARRGASPAEEFAYTFVQYDREWLPLLKAHADKVGIEFMCTAFLPQDVAVIAPLVKRFKVAAKEACDKQLQGKIRKIQGDRQVIVSFNKQKQAFFHNVHVDHRVTLYCVSKYPCPLDEINLSKMRLEDQGYDGVDIYEFDGLSDHTGHVLTGAVAVGAGASVIEAHVKLPDTPEDNPDFPHSHWIVRQTNDYNENFPQYVQNIRTAERMM